MARKTFISYKYSEAQGLRDNIIQKLGKDSQFYKGETSDSSDLTDTSTETIKKNLTDMMHNTSVTIVIISPNIKLSKWIDWEIEYCLKEITRQDRTSKTNGIVCVIQKVNGSYSWFKTKNQGTDGCSFTSYSEHLVYNIISKNRVNQNPKKYICDTCQTINALKGSYISYIEEETFLADPQKYIENAFDKSEDVDGYDLTKQK
ncbi:MAG: TIR domain-containing protein [Bacteroidota bacterium]|nr:TIR domain-containing protein [Bacteroidota bacterium]